MAGLPGLSVIDYNAAEQNNYQYLVTEVEERDAGISRDAIVDLLWAENVLARRYFYPGVHRMEAYRAFYPHADLLLPETEHLSQRVMILPTGTSVGEKEVGTICALIRYAIEHAPKITRKLAARK